MAKFIEIHSVEEIKIILSQLLTEYFNKIKEELTTSSEFLTPKETATFLKISEGSVRNWSNEGILTRYLIGGKVLFDKNEIINTLKDKQC